MSINNNRIFDQNQDGNYTNTCSESGNSLHVNSNSTDDDKSKQDSDIVSLMSRLTLQDDEEGACAPRTSGNDNESNKGLTSLMSSLMLRDNEKGSYAPRTSTDNNE
ncbi:hypothetical protein [Candidatus Ichthyocystis hellenicum]|uniref:hypothetical protein n=1 Tax=Candidatus Ichthyocystis hellenicum TaxID=1561003 RepID=UPI000B826A38|nr:hypothetical protein [Candidatus Ichthyocystis hellenicum]